jgi:hypothetical protein
MLGHQFAHPRHPRDPPAALQSSDYEVFEHP